jgi:cytochrome c biogenesis protein CcmG/thiol:disulfide interchange protein DsbE
VRRVKNISILLLLALLGGCSSQASIVPILGRVVSCESIAHTTKTVGLVFPCLDGKSSLYFSSLRGPLIVNVWGSWCAPCKDEVPIIRSFYAKAEAQLQILGVDVEEAKSADGSAFIVQNGMTWPNLIDPDGRSRGYFGMGVPVTWFIDKNGLVVHKKIGAMVSEGELRELTLKYLNIAVG